MGNCSSSKSAQATEPAQDGPKTAAPVAEPKTLLTSDVDGSQMLDSSAVDLVKKYLVDAYAASESKALECLAGADRKKLADARSGVDAPLLGDASPATVDISFHKALESYLDDARAASTSEVQEALQGLSVASQRRLAGTLDSLLALDAQLVTAVEVNTTLLPEDIETPAKSGDSLPQGGPHAPEPVLVEAQPSNAKGWLSCCNVSIDSTVEFRVILADSSSEFALLTAEKQ